MRVVVLFSGGLDSTVLLWHLRDEGHHVLAFTVNYGQRNAQELAHAASLAARAGAGYRRFEMPSFAGIAPGSSQTNPFIPMPTGDSRVTVVPNRNMVLLALAAAYGITTHAEALAYGAHVGGHAGYPDCRPAFVEAMRVALGVCDWQPLQLLAPFLGWPKARVVSRGAELGVPMALTCSCYDGGTIHCGKCRACAKRQAAFAEAGVEDETEYVHHS